MITRDQAVEITDNARKDVNASFSKNSKSIDIQKVVDEIGYKIQAKASLGFGYLELHLETLPSMKAFLSKTENKFTIMDEDLQEIIKAIESKGFQVNPGSEKYKYRNIFYLGICW